MTQVKILDVAAYFSCFPNYFGKDMNPSVLPTSRYIQIVGYTLFKAWLSNTFIRNKLPNSNQHSSSEVLTLNHILFVVEALRKGI